MALPHGRAGDRAPATSPTCPAFAAAVPAGDRDADADASTATRTSSADGGVLVVGASATGVQLADEIHRSGRPVTLAVGEHVRVPRTYRGQGHPVVDGRRRRARRALRRGRRHRPGAPAAVAAARRHARAGDARPQRAHRRSACGSSAGSPGSATARRSSPARCATSARWPTSSSAGCSTPSTSGRPTSGLDGEVDAAAPLRRRPTVEASPPLGLDLTSGDDPDDHLGDRLPARLLVARRAGPRPQGPDPPRRRRRRRLAGPVPDGHAVPAPPQVDASSTAPAPTPTSSAPTSPATSSRLQSDARRGPVSPQPGRGESFSSGGFLGAAPMSADVQRSVRQRRERHGLRDEHVEALGPRRRGARPAVRVARSRRACRLADVPSAGDPHHLVRVGARRLVLLAGVGQEVGGRGRRRVRRQRASWRRRRARRVGEGAGPLGPPGRSRSEQDGRLRRAAVARRRLRRHAIFAITVFVALRIAFSAVNDALGAHPTGSSPTRCPRRSAMQSRSGARSPTVTAHVVGMVTDSPAGAARCVVGDAGPKHACGLDGGGLDDVPDPPVCWSGPQVRATRMPSPPAGRRPSVRPVK